MSVPILDDILSNVRTDEARADAARAALSYVSSVVPTFLLNHSIRSYLFGKAVATAQGLEAGRHYEDGLLFLGCLMHDIGLTDVADGNQRFEVDGADRAAAFVLEHGLGQNDADIVWDAIALHTSGGIASRKAPEIALAYAGIAIDVFGFGAEQVPPDVVASAHDRLPRLDLETRLAEAIQSQVAAHPANAVPFTFSAGLVNEQAGHEVVPGYAALVATSPWRTYR